MSEYVYWIIEADVREGKLQQLKEIMVEMSEATMAEEPGTLNYEWSLSEDEKTCHIFERYKDSDATMIHMGNFGSKFAKRFMEIVKPGKFVLYGNPNEQVLKTLAPMGAVQFSSAAGFSR